MQPRGGRGKVIEGEHFESMDFLGACVGGLCSDHLTQSDASTNRVARERGGRARSSPRLLEIAGFLCAKNLLWIAVDQRSWLEAIHSVIVYTVRE
jgi:hypothetical protein